MPQLVNLAPDWLTIEYAPDVHLTDDINGTSGRVGEVFVDQGRISMLSSELKDMDVTYLGLSRKGWMSFGWLGGALLVGITLVGIVWKLIVSKSKE